MAEPTVKADFEAVLVFYLLAWGKHSKKYFKAELLYTAVLTFYKSRSIFGQYPVILCSNLHWQVFNL